MNPVMLMLELMLAVLLAATLVFGWRLERKLRALRDSQAGFVTAMQGLDAAAARAQSGLEKLRLATEEAQGELGPRIQAAQDAAARLEALTGEAEIAAKRAESAALEVEASAAKLASALQHARPLAPKPAPKLSAPSAAALPEPIARRPEPVAPPVPQDAPETKRPAIDFAALLSARTTRQPLPVQNQEPQVSVGGEPKPAGSRLREAAALLRGG